jgi:hypothetical protein
MLRHFHLVRSLALATLCAGSLAAARCDSVPLFAPNGSTITLLADTDTLAPGGSTTITALVLEPAGTPPHSGTQVVFISTLGSVTPQQTTTDSAGFVTATFTAGAGTGAATITAQSGGASSGASGSVKITIAAAQ